MTQPTLPPMLADPEILAYRSSAPVDGRVAARLAEAILRPIESRDWASHPLHPPHAGSLLPRFLFGEVWIDRRASAVYGDVLWVIGQLAGFARDEHIEFEIQLGAMKGRVSTGGIDAGAQEILLQAVGKMNGKTLRLRERRQRRTARAQTG